MNDKKFKKYQAFTFFLLLIGYMGYYFCRSNFSVSVPLLLNEFSSEGVTKETIGIIASAGVLIYAIGKIINGTITDFISGKKMILYGMLGSIIATVFFGLSSSYKFFMLAWVFNRFFQSAGWGATIKTVSSWSSHKKYATVMGIISLSFLFGDVIARLFFSKVIDMEMGWRGVFFSAALVLSAISFTVSLFLKESPEDVGYKRMDVNPKNLFGNLGDKDKPENLGNLFTTYFRSIPFWLVVVMSFGLTLMRETFNFWTPTYLYEVAKLNEAQAAGYSLAFPLFGGISVILFGFASDKWFKAQKGRLIFLSSIPLTVVLIAMGLNNQSYSTLLSIIFVSLTAFLMLGPYSFLAGAIALDIGGKSGSSTAAGLIDSAGYLGALFSGWGIGKLATSHGWGGTFVILGLVCLLVLVTSFFYWFTYEKENAKFKVS